MPTYHAKAQQKMENTEQVNSVKPSKNPSSSLSRKSPNTNISSVVLSSVVTGEVNGGKVVRAIVIEA